MTVSLNMLVNTLGLLYLAAVLRISILVLASIVVSIFQHSISFVGAFIVILLLLFFYLTGECWNTHTFDCLWLLQFSLFIATNSLVLQSSAIFLLFCHTCYHKFAGVYSGVSSFVYTDVLQVGSTWVTQPCSETCKKHGNFQNLVDSIKIHLN